MSARRSTLNLDASPKSAKKVKHTRKIRKSFDLICFDTTQDEGLLSGSFRSAAKSVKKIKQANDSLHIAHEEVRETNQPTVDSVVQHAKTTAMPSSPMTNNAKNNNGMRKIVKAKRLLKNKAYEQFDDVVQVDPVKNVAQDEKIQNPTNSQLIITTLPSPISPSAHGEASSTSLSLTSTNLDFKSSKEDLRPSTQGAVHSSRRRTYELEDSVIDLDILKSVSECDSKDSLEYTTPQELKFSKITMRRKWEKIHEPEINSSPHWINKKLKKSLSPLVMPKLGDVDWSNQKLKLLSPVVQKDSSTKQSSTQKFVSKVKVPNFAAIHERALKKIESIDEYKVRKAKRANMLLSGKKPEALPQLSQKESRKQLRFAPDISAKEKSPTFIPLPSTPIPRKALNASVGTTPIPFKWDFSKIPRVGCVSASPVHETQKIKTSLLKENIQPMQKVVCKFKGKTTTKNNGTLKPLNFQFNANFKNLKTNVFQKTEVKNFSKKIKPEKDTLESRRCAIKGVRSNRRFELLMNMRKGK